MCNNCHSTIRVKALKDKQSTNLNQWAELIIHNWIPDGRGTVLWIQYLSKLHYNTEETWHRPCQLQQKPGRLALDRASCCSGSGHAVDRNLVSSSVAHASDACRTYSTDNITQSNCTSDYTNLHTETTVVWWYVNCWTIRLIHFFYSSFPHSQYTI